jgi:hypothetical protein
LNDQPPEQDDLSADDHRAALTGAVNKWVTEYGYRVESKDDFQAIIVRGHRPNHILHLILTVVTVGLWLVPWIIISATGGERRRIIDVDQSGEVGVSKQARAR